MILLYFFVFLIVEHSQAILYPYDSATRETKSLDGLWRFKPDPGSVGMDEEWYLGELTGDGVEDMPVPSSFNDIGTSSSLRDLIGLVWYERDVILPQSWHQDKRIFLRFGSVHYAAHVWVDGVFVGSHEGGHMAFEFDVTAFSWKGIQSFRSDRMFKTKLFVRILPCDSLCQ